MATEIRIHPFGLVDPRLLADLRSGVERSFGLEATLGESLPIPRDAYSSEREQFHSTRFLAKLAELNRKERAIRLGVTDVDLYVPELNFVFGEASRGDQVAVFSTARLDPRHSGEPANPELFANRALTEAVHELGHVFGLGHCARPDCVMWFSNTLRETDRKGSRFCPGCEHRMRKAAQRAA